MKLLPREDNDYRERITANNKKYAVLKKYNSYILSSEKKKRALFWGVEIAVRKPSYISFLGFLRSWFWNHDAAQIEIEIQTRNFCELFRNSYAIKCEYPQNSVNSFLSFRYDVKLSIEKKKKTKTKTKHPSPGCTLGCEGLIFK